MHFGAILEVASEKAEQDAVQGTGGTGKQNICSRHPLQGGGNDMIIRHALIHDAVHKEPYPGDILIRDGKLVSVGDPADAEDEILDAEGLHAYPGFVDAHSHIGLDGYGGPTGGSYDYNEMNDICCPQLRGMDSYYPLDPAIMMALEGSGRRRDNRGRRSGIRECAGWNLHGGKTVRKNSRGSDDPAGGRNEMRFRRESETLL